jgi:hypothetical protein
MASFVLMMLQEESSSGGGIFATVFMICWLGFIVLMVAAMWVVFTKANEPGWACLVPIYNLIVLCRICGKPWWWLFLMCIPLVNIIIGIILGIALAGAFGKGTGFGIGIALLPFIFYPMLAWGDAKYQGAPA